MGTADVEDVVKDAAVAGAAAYVGTTVMEQFNMATFSLEPAEDQEREQEVRPGPPPQVAAQKIAGALGIELREGQLEKAGMGLHYALPLSWTPVYMGLRRRLALTPLAAGLFTGGAMSLIADEGITARWPSPRARRACAPCARGPRAA